MGAYEKFYLASKQGRRVVTRFDMGSADITFKGKAGALFEMNAPTLVVAVLAHFAEPGARHSMRQLLELTGLGARSLEETLLSITLAKHRVLKKEPKSGRCAPDDVFFVNPSFHAPARKFRIGTVSLSERPTERAETARATMLERTHMLEAALVRIMKSRKRIPLQGLIAEAIADVKKLFAPTPVMVKEVVEGLIERDYLERDDDQPSILVYVA